MGAVSQKSLLGETTYLECQVANIEDGAQPAELRAIDACVFIEIQHS